MAGLYVYGIIGATDKKDFGEGGLGHTGRVYTIRSKDIAAVVSDSAPVEYDMTEENAMAHYGIVKRVFEEHTILPMAFSQVFKNEEVLLSLLKASYEVLKDALKTLHHKVEIEVRVLAPVPLPREAVVVRPREALFNRETKDDFVKDCTSNFRAALGKFCVSSTQEKPFGKRMVLNDAFLVEKDKVDQFLVALDEVDAKYKSLTTRVSEPLPPYNSFRIDLSRASA